MATIEEELKRYRMCRAEMDRTKGGHNCAVCRFNVPPIIFHRFIEIDAILSGEVA